MKKFISLPSVMVAVCIFVAGLGFAFCKITATMDTRDAEEKAREAIVIDQIKKASPKDAYDIAMAINEKVYREKFKAEMIAKTSSHFPSEKPSSKTFSQEELRKLRSNPDRRGEKIAAAK